VSVLTLYPPEEAGVRRLKGLYLALALHRAAPPGGVLIYANYIASMDGRISLRDRHTGRQQVPAALANARDWRLYQELAAQSDVLIVSARYFRQLAAGCAQDVLPVGDAAAFADLHAWRRRQGMAAQPDVLVLSNSLDIPPAVLPRDRQILVLCGSQAPRAAEQRLLSLGVRVFRDGAPEVQGAFVRDVLCAEGYRAAYMIAGPRVHRTLLAAGVLDQCFLTQRHLLLAGEDFATCLAGELRAPVALKLVSLHLDAGIEPAQQFACFRLRKVRQHSTFTAMEQTT